MSDSSNNPQRGQYDPGWNDPPKLQYNNSTHQTGKTKLNLNKRIAFPLQSSSTVNTSKPTAIVQPSPSLLPFTALSSINTQSTLSNISASSSQPPIAIVPPMLHSNSPQLIQRVPPTDSINNSNINNRNNQLLLNQNQNNDNILQDELNENAREYCLNTFQRFILNIQETNNVRSDEVQRRINLMNQMWLSGTLLSSVQRKLFKIAKALEANNFNDAIEYHRALVVDHSNVCVAWGAALRQIILTIQQYQNQNASRNIVDGIGIINNAQLSSSSVVCGSSNSNNVLIPNTAATIITSSTTTTSAPAATETTVSDENDDDGNGDSNNSHSQSESSNNIQHI